MLAMLWLCRSAPILLLPTCECTHVAHAQSFFMLKMSQPMLAMLSLCRSALILQSFSSCQPVTAQVGATTNAAVRLSPSYCDLFCACLLSGAQFTYNLTDFVR